MKVRPSPAIPASTKAINMLGYDWIAALLDQSAENGLTDRQEAYFRELREFRRLHRDECQNDAVNLPAEYVPTSYSRTQAQ